MKKNIVQKAYRVGRKQAKRGIALTMAAALAAMLFPYGEVRPERISAAEEETGAIEVNASNLYAANDGIFDGWGTSLCWFGNRIGGSAQTTEQAVRCLIDPEEGLGLNIIRFNIGGGDDPSHDHITRTDSKMPGYWGEYDASSDTFTYDMSKDENQRNVLLAMLAKNPDLDLEAFSNSPPYFMTYSGCTSGSENGSDNLLEDKYDDFADYLATVVEKYREEYGVQFQSVEAMNENGWSIERNGNKQEGCSFSRGAAQSKMILALDQALKEHGLEGLDLAGCDESSPAEMLTSLNKMSEEAVQALERIDTHTYSTASMKKLSAKAVELGKKLWMSETDGSSTSGGDDAGEMRASLWFAGRIGEDLNVLQPAAWIMWQAIASYCGSEPFAGNYDPASLDQVSMDTDGFWGVTYADMDKEEVVLTKKYYTLGQFTRYIHKGDQMIVGNKSNTIAYDADNKELKIVSVNKSAKAEERKFAFEGYQIADGTTRVIRTSGDLKSGENWAEAESTKAEADGLTVTLAPYSVTTFIISGVYKDGETVETTAPQMTEAPSESVMPVETVTEAPSVQAVAAVPSAVPAADAGTAPSVSAVPAASGSPAPVSGDTIVAKVSGVKLSKIQKKSVTVSWKKAAGADKYVVAYAASKPKLAKLKNGKVKADGVKTKTVSKTQCRLSGLKKKTTYYIKVCGVATASGSKVYGKYSAVRKGKTKK